MLCCTTADVIDTGHRQCLVVICLRIDYLFNVELYETVMFRLFKGADSTVQIMFRRTRNYSVKREVNYV
jgi:hypothetical protein